MDYHQFLKALIFVVLLPSVILAETESDSEAVYDLFLRNIRQSGPNGQFDLSLRQGFARPLLKQSYGYGNNNNNNNNNNGLSPCQVVSALALIRNRVQGPLRKHRHHWKRRRSYCYREMQRVEDMLNVLMTTLSRNNNCGGMALSFIGAADGTGLFGGSSYRTDDEPFDVNDNDDNANVNDQPIM